jgi:putative nucleotidyltransferase with HDIG domain
MSLVAKLMNIAGRTIYAFLPGLIKPDDGFARRYLTGAEYVLYAKMDLRDRHHAGQVTKMLLGKYPQASPELLRAALLHDVGKSSSKYRPIHRILVHLYTPKDIPISPRLHGLKGAQQRNLHHDRYGAELILNSGGDAAVAEIVARHHVPNGHREAAMLKEIDEQF